MNAQNNALNNTNEVEKENTPFHVVPNKKRTKNPEIDERPTRNRQTTPEPKAPKNQDM